jgi:thiosulfate reductase/polysulfide reductase chain A
MCLNLILFGRNMFSSLRIAENLQTLDMLDNGGKLTYVDVRQTITGLKSSRVFQVRPGTDYALALGMIHKIIKREAYYGVFIDRSEAVYTLHGLCRFLPLDNSSAQSRNQKGGQM